MKTLIIFDLDNTLYSHRYGKLLPNTVKLLEHLHQNPNITLGVATGRGPGRIQMLDDVSHFFTYKIYINGALAYQNNQQFYHNEIPSEVIKKVLKQATALDIPIGMITKDHEYISYIDENVLLGLRGFDQKPYHIDPYIYLKEPVFQLWLFTDDMIKKQRIIKDNPQLRAYLWHKGGLDLVYKNTNKVNPIKEIMRQEKYDQLICVGDGQNDIDMIEYADIGIALDNSGFQELKEKADLIAPHVDLDQLYQFFLNQKLFTF